MKDCEPTMDGEYIAREHIRERELRWIIKGAWYRGFVIAKDDQNRFAAYPNDPGVGPGDGRPFFGSEHAVRIWIQQRGGWLDRPLPWLVNTISSWYYGLVITEDHPEWAKEHGPVAVYAPHRCFLPQDVLAYATTRGAARTWINSLREDGS